MFVCNFHNVPEKIYRMAFLIGDIDIADTFCAYDALNVPEHGKVLNFFLNEMQLIDNIEIW